MPGCCDICSDLEGKIFSVDEMQIGLNMPPMHPNCRCAVAAAVPEAENPPAIKTLKESGGVYGAWTDINDPYNIERERIANDLYTEIKNRKRTFEIESVAKNSGFTVEEVQRVYEHIFVRDHRFEDGRIGKFDPDYYMAHSWLRLRDGKQIQVHDIILLKHELAEERIMGESLEIIYETAHNEVAETYDYKSALLEYLKEHDA